MRVNPDLALTVAASLEGAREQIHPGEPVNEALYDITDEEVHRHGIEALPDTLKAAIEASDRDELARSVRGATIHELYSRYKHDEWHRFHAHVSAWDQSEYLQFF